MERKRWLLGIGLCFLCFFGIPLKVNEDSVEKTEVSFKHYIRKFNKSYNENDTEYLVRFHNFMNSIRLIQELNKNRLTNQSALYGLTEFSDLSQDEFIKAKLQVTKINFHPINHNHLLKSAFPSGDSKLDFFQNLKKLMLAGLPAKVDWRSNGIVGSVRDQKKCGACWAFGAVETIESMNAKKTGTFTELSVQEMVDCAQFGNFGCEGGDSCSLLKWLNITKIKVTTEKSYPYAYKTQACDFKAPKIGVQIRNYACENFVGSEEKILELLAFHGPVTASINALMWQYYLGGIIQFHCPGSSQNLNHAVQIIGYDLTVPVPYYIVRNSWGLHFGDNGYLYIAIGKNVCGLAYDVSSLDVL